MQWKEVVLTREIFYCFAHAHYSRGSQRFSVLHWSYTLTQSSRFVLLGQHASNSFGDIAKDTSTITDTIGVVKSSEGMYFDIKYVNVNYPIIFSYVLVKTVLFMPTENNS